MTTRTRAMTLTPRTWTKSMDALGDATNVDAVLKSARSYEAHLHCY